VENQGRRAGGGIQVARSRTTLRVDAACCCVCTSISGNRSISDWVISDLIRYPYTIPALQMVNQYHSTSKHNDARDKQISLSLFFSSLTFRPPDPDTMPPVRSRGARHCKKCPGSPLRAQCEHTKAGRKFLSVRVTLSRRTHR
jgi:hypothetical protein